MAYKPKTAIVAVGGNALVVDERHQSIPDQFDAAVVTSRYVADMIEQGWTVVLTHGNGPQVGFILRRSGLAKGIVPEVPIDYADADTQGAIGYMFQRALYNEFLRRGLKRRAIAVVTQVLVDAADPAFASPTKPVGGYMTEEIAQSLAQDFGWTVQEDAGRGWRRVVPSPMPRRIVERDMIEALIDAGVIVIACGGGGIPVVENARGELQGLEAVIDKDFASSLLARELGAELFVVCTGVEKVAIDFGTPAQRFLDDMTPAQARAWLAQGQFPRGSMGPKVEAVLAYLDGGGRHALITNAPNLGRALRGDTGTHVVAPTSD
jgi:carbamate kinase